jgi:hypothetical protein
MELEFSWDAAKRQLKRAPESAACSRDENVRYASWTRAIRGSDQVEASVARYEMAKLAYEQRDFYQPCRTIHGGPAPGFIIRNDFSVIGDIRSGLRALHGCATGREIAAIAEKSEAVRQAMTFQDYVARVSAIESYNESCCKTLLMAHAWLDELNPEGDATAIEMLRQLLREWFRIGVPAEDALARSRQARSVCRDYRWLKSAWRDLWESP